MPMPKFVRPPEPPFVRSSVVVEKKSCCNDAGPSCPCHKFGGWFMKKLFITFTAILLVYGIFYVGTLIRNNIKKYDYIGKADRIERTITVNGSGKMNGNNDIAMTTIGFSNVDKDVSKAQVNNKKVMDQVLSALKAFGVADKDLQTNYSIYPEYNCSGSKVILYPACIGVYKRSMQL